MEFGRATKVNVWVIIGLIVGYLFIGWAFCAIMAFVYPEPEADDDTPFFLIALFWPVFLGVTVILGVCKLFRKTINAISVSTWNKKHGVNETLNDLSKEE